MFLVSNEKYGTLSIYTLALLLLYFDLYNLTHLMRTSKQLWINHNYVGIISMDNYYIGSTQCNRL